MARLAFDLTILRVLLVEEDTFSREFELSAFRELGASSIVVAEDAEDAMDILSRGIAIDLVVFDWNTPTQDGVGLVKSARQQWPGLSFLMLTNNEGLDQIAAAREAGVDGCLIKPFSLAKLRESIQLALISKVTGGRVSAAVASDPELDEIAASLRQVIGSKNGANGDASPELVKDSNRLAERLSDQLNGFVGSLDAVSPAQMEVVRLHLDCVSAVLSGREDLLEHETQNMLVDGLNLAAELVSR